MTEDEIKKFVVNLKSGAKYDVYIGRGSKWGNPFSHMKHSQAEVIVETRQEAIECFKNWIQFRPDLIADAKKELKGKILGCFCAPLDCHGEVLVKIANEEDNE